MRARVLSVQVGLPVQHRWQGEGDDEAATWTSGIYKLPATGPVWIGHDGLEGDGQADLRVHGGPDRAVLLFPEPHYADFAHLVAGPIPPGGFGENLTLDSLCEHEVCLGDKWRCGEAVLEVSQPRLPCYKLGRRLGNPGVTQAVLASGRGGWYCRVLQEGHVRANDEVFLEERPHPDWAVSRAFRVYLDRTADREELRSLPCLSQLWKQKLS